MADEEHLRILGQGVEAWNVWRAENPDIRPDLMDPDFDAVSLTRADLRRANFNWADLRYANLKGADLGQADLQNADLSYASLQGANLTETKLRGARLCSGTNLGAANLTGANLRDAAIINSNLMDANLSRADLFGTDLHGAFLKQADLSGATLGQTSFVDVDLSETKGLKSSKHRRASVVDHRTLEQSKAVPPVFWRGCGLSERLIEYLPSIFDDAIQFYSCFISYSSKDQEFAERLHADLQNQGVRCWFAPHDMRTGDRIRDTIDEQIRVHEKLLLILSESSVSSNWVENEVEAAIDKEKDRKTVLFPVRIDTADKDSSIAWARTIERTRHITDFSGWKDHDAYQKAFQRLLRDLKVER